MKGTMRLLTGGILAMTLASLGHAQDKNTGARPPDLSLTAVGRQHHSIATTSKQAQEYFDQGLTFIYGFNHEEAQRAFQRAAELDPASPMPLWGIGMAIGPNYNQDVDREREKLAHETLQKAVKLAEHGPEAERDYVNTLATRFSGEAKPDYPKLAQDYAQAMKRLAEKYPDDLDAGTLYAESLMDLNPWKLWSNDGKAAPNTEEIVAQLERVLARDPMHAGANHFYIHALEASDHPERALTSARRLENMIPQAGHLVHMPAHIYARTGDFSDAVRCNVEAAKADKVYARKAEQEGSLYDLMYHSHNEHFLASSASMEGRYVEAKAAADGLATRLLPHAEGMPMLDAFVMTPLWVDARFAKWDAILAAPEPAKELPATHSMWRYARTLAFAARKQNEQARAEQALFAMETQGIPGDTPLVGFNTARDLLSLAGHVLDARISASAGNMTEAIAHWRRAVAIQDTLNYDEPADWYYPVRESLGGALLAAGQAGEAEKVFRDDLQRNPRNPRALFGLMHSLTAQHKDADAEWVRSQFETAWKHADVELKVAEL